MSAHEPRCTAENTHGPNWCTRERGHPGWHVDTSGPVTVAWANDEADR